MTEVDVGLAGGVSHVRRFFRRVRRKAPDLHRAPHDRFGALPDGRRLRLRAGRCAAANRARYRPGNCRQEPARGPRGETVVQRHRRHAVARRLPVRAVTDRGAGVQRERPRKRSAPSQKSESRPSRARWHGSSHEIALVAALAVRAQGHGSHPRHWRRRPDRVRPHGRGHDEAAPGSDAGKSVVEIPTLVSTTARCSTIPQ